MCYATCQTDSLPYRPTKTAITEIRDPRTGPPLPVGHCAASARLSGYIVDTKHPDATAMVAMTIVAPDTDSQ